MLTRRSSRCGNSLHRTQPSMFAASDGIVLKSTWQHNSQLGFKFQKPVLCTACRNHGKFHSETSALLVEEQCIRDPTDRDVVFDAINTMPPVQTKAGLAVQRMQMSTKQPVRTQAYVHEAFQGEHAFRSPLRTSIGRTQRLETCAPG